MPFERYKSRQDAGRILVEFIKNSNIELRESLQRRPEQFFCFAIPNGGVPVAEGFCFAIKCNYDILIVRKIKIPYNPEAGFGAVTTDGTVMLNESLLPHLNLTETDINDSIETTKREIRERLHLYKKSPDLEEFYKKVISNRQIFMIDDGLASGYTMLAAIKMVKQYGPEKIFLAIPTAPLRTVKKIEPEVNGIFSPNIRNVMQFAVADAYLKWYDVPESEILDLLKKSRFYLKS